MRPAESYQAIQNLDALYGASSSARILQLIEAADALSAALQTLRTHPCPDGAERVATQIYGMHRQAVLTVDSLIRERKA